MKEKGFTLIELVCVILLLAIIISLSTIAIVNVVQNSKERENKASMELIKTAVNDYIDKYENDFHIENGVTYCIDVQDLIDENLLISNISYDGEKINEKTVKTEYNNNNYSYKLDDKETCMISETKKYEITNLVSNGSFENGTTDWVITTSAFNSEIIDDSKINGSKALKLTVIQSFNNNNQALQVINTIPNHTYYFTAYTNTHSSLSDLNTKIAFSPGAENDWTWLINSASTAQYQDLWKKHSILYNNEDYNSLKVRIAYGGNSNVRVGDYYYIDSVLVVDLTETFGAGNEPSKDWCDEHINYFDGTTIIYK